MKIEPVLFASVIFLVLILLRVEAAPANISGRVGELAADEFEEILMESEVSRRFLAGNQADKLSYRALEKGKVCDARIYGDCTGTANKDNRPCTLYNRCKRSPR